jgi:YfiH family protein
MTGGQVVPLDAAPFEDTQLLSFPSFSDIRGFAHCVTTRPWNMAVHHGPDAELAADRRRRICRHLGLPFERLTVANQIHSGHVLRVLPEDAGAGREDHAAALRFVDGMACDLAGTALMQISADCPLILAVDPQRRALGTAHASWRGTVAHIARELVRRLRGEFGTRPEDLIACIAPCAGPCCYEVGDDVYRIAAAHLPDADEHFVERGGRRYFDLRSANVAQLVREGVPSSSIFVAAECTMTDDRFYSHRRDGPSTGRFALIAGFV